MTLDVPWRLTLTVRSESREELGWLQRALEPELAREVPRTTARAGVDPTGALVIEIEARDTGAVRAAANTYLGWIRLAEETVRRAKAAQEPSSRP